MLVKKKCIQRDNSSGAYYLLFTGKRMHTVEKYEKTERSRRQREQNSCCLEESRWFSVSKNNNCIPVVCDQLRRTKINDILAQRVNCHKHKLAREIKSYRMCSRKRDFHLHFPLGLTWYLTSSLFCTLNNEISFIQTLTQ